MEDQERYTGTITKYFDYRGFGSFKHPLRKMTCSGILLTSEYSGKRSIGMLCEFLLQKVLKEFVQQILSR